MDHEGRSVTLSSIFKWYADDFGPPDVVCITSPCTWSASGSMPMHHLLVRCAVKPQSWTTCSGPTFPDLTCDPAQLLPWLLRFLPDGPAHELEDLLAHLGPDNIKVCRSGAG